MSKKLFAVSLLVLVLVAACAPAPSPNAMPAPAPAPTPRVNAPAATPQKVAVTSPVPATPTMKLPDVSPGAPPTRKDILEEPAVGFSILFYTMYSHALENQWNLETLGSRKILLGGNDVVTFNALAQWMKDNGIEWQKNDIQVAACNDPSEDFKFASWKIPTDTTDGHESDKPAAINWDRCCSSVARSIIFQLAAWYRAVSGGLMFDTSLYRPAPEPEWSDCFAWQNFSQMVSDLSKFCGPRGWEFSFSKSQHTLTMRKVVTPTQMVAHAVGGVVVASIPVAIFAGGKAIGCAVGATAGPIGCLVGAAVTP